ncbi:MAG: Reverse transcriptase (RNA-dependent DNA polymerase), partial [Candidatus Riflebacteria bacterium]|nr:Reverse transcriptase (RNA-dependent DNA polymerase) [Candidatus Riflebacteria bacterium]
MNIVANANNLIEAYRNSAKSGSWKSSVQKYGINLLRNVYQTRKALLDGKYTLKPCNVFTLSERGKKRLIRSIHISDRVVQRCLCDNVLLPSLQKYLIYDNGASLKDKGVNFTRKRIVTHLAEYYRKFGRDGYIL